MKSAVVCIVKDEEYAVFEWCLYHSLIGFDSVIVFDNNSTDGTSQELSKAALFADVRVIDWPQHPGQLQSYNHALDVFGEEFDTFAMIDADEFFVPIFHADMREFLANHKDVFVTGVHWFMYGSNGYDRRPPGLVTENFLMRSSNPNAHIKSVVRPGLAVDPPVKFINPHYVSGGPYFDGGGDAVKWLKPGKTLQLPGDLPIRINHYYCKSREDYEKKLRRGNADSRSLRTDSFSFNDRNDVSDPILPIKYGEQLNQIKRWAAMTRSKIAVD